MAIKNKRVLITAGPTWVPIDSVRVISNIATGQTGILLAEKLERLGAKVTLLLGTSEARCINKRIRLIRFKFFNELRDIIKKELKNKRYDVIIHSAAASDFKPDKIIRGKIISAGRRVLKLKPLPKIIRDIRYSAKEAKVVMFKLEIGVTGGVLLKRSKIAQKKLGVDLVVANTLNPYRAFIMDGKGKSIFVRNKKELADRLVRII